MTFEFEDTIDTPKKKHKVIDMNDIERNRKAREKDKFKTEITDDIDDVLGNVFDKVEKRFKEKKEEKDKTPKSKIIKFFKLIGILGLGILILNFVLFNVSLLRYFIKSVFMGG